MPRPARATLFPAETRVRCKQCQILFVMLTDILNESTYLIYRGADASQLVAAAYNCEPSDQGIMLENVVSRKKQLIPALINTLAERKM